MSKHEDIREQIQDDLNCILGDTIPTTMLDDVCQVIVDRFKELTDDQKEVCQ